MWFCCSANKRRDFSIFASLWRVSCSSVRAFFLTTRPWEFSKVVFVYHYQIGIYLGCIKDLVWEDEVIPLGLASSLLLLRLVWVEDGLLVLQPRGEEEEVVTPEKTKDLFVSVLRKMCSTHLSTKRGQYVAVWQFPEEKKHIDRFKISYLPSESGWREVGQEVERVAQKNRLNLTHQLDSGNKRS